jgi:hypothetical protein
VKNLIIISAFLLSGLHGFGQNTQEIRLFCEFSGISNDTLNLDSIVRNSCVNLKYSFDKNSMSKAESDNTIIVTNLNEFDFNNYEIDNVKISSLRCLGGLTNIKLETNCVSNRTSIFFNKQIDKNRLFFEVSIKKYGRALKKKLYFSIWTK